jgi:hypothetical protein
MVGGDDRDTAPLLGGFQNASDAFVHDDFVAHAIGAHLRLLIIGIERLAIGKQFRRRDDLPILAGERLVAIVVEEERHVRIFFRLGAAKLAQIFVRQEFAEDVFHLRRLGEGDVNGQALLVRGHGVEEDFQLIPAIESGKIFQHERLGQFARAIATVVVKNDAIAVAHGCARR